MNLPPGVALKTGLDAVVIDFFALLRELKDRQFNGYVAIACQGKYGIEEGTEVFDSGKPVASFYEYYAFKKTLTGGEAFKRVLNASAASKAVIDVIELTGEQVQLATAFNESAIFVPSEVDLKPRKVVFDSQFEEEQKLASLVPDREELLKKYRLSSAVYSPADSSIELPGDEDYLAHLAAGESEKE